MTESQRDELRRELIDRLTGIYRRVRADVSAQLVDRAIETDPSDEAEESATDELRTLDAQLEDRERQLAHLIEGALRRLRTNQFGVCVACDGAIPFDRLRAVPWTLRCADDEASAEPTARHPTL